jgi:phosphonate transport system substrate-binding protein
MTGAQGKSPLRFATFLAPSMLPVYRFLAERISDCLGQPVELVVGTSFDQFERGEADLGVICGLPYVWLADRHPSPVEPLAAPVLIGARYGSRPIYYSDVIVRHDSPITRLEELEGRSWAYNEPASHSGHTVTLDSLVRMGAQPGFLGRVVEAGFHQRAIRLVAAGAVDAAAIDSQGLAIEFRDHPRLADGLRVIGSFRPAASVNWHREPGLQYANSQGGPLGHSRMSIKAASRSRSTYGSPLTSIATRLMVPPVNR